MHSAALVWLGVGAAALGWVRARVWAAEGQGVVATGGWGEAWAPGRAESDGERAVACERNRPILTSRSK
ncbi:MAG: hypothetical protein WBI79_08175 [Kiritimatiellia bacterium]